MRKLTMRDKRLILCAMSIFVATSMLAVGINSLKWGWHVNYSISRYVGLETWSAIVFAIGNAFVAGLLGRYLYIVGEKWQLRKWFFWVVVIMAAVLIGLSVWPVCYFDRFISSGKSVPTLMHEICSRTMFACMLIVALTVQFCRRASGKTRFWCAIFVVYGLLCCVAYLSQMRWFCQMMLVFESCYLVGFLVLCCGLQSKISKERSQYGRVKTRSRSK